MVSRRPWQRWLDEWYRIGPLDQPDPADPAYQASLDHYLQLIFGRGGASGVSADLRGLKTLHLVRVDPVGYELTRTETAMGREVLTLRAGGASWRMLDLILDTTQPMLRRFADLASTQAHQPRAGDDPRLGQALAEHSNPIARYHAVNAVYWFFRDLRTDLDHVRDQLMLQLRAGGVPVQDLAKAAGLSRHAAGRILHEQRQDALTAAYEAGVPVLRGAYRPL